MVFSSITFLFLFLPISLILYHSTSSVTGRNVVLLAMSVIFYVWGEMQYVAVMFLSILLTWTVGKILDNLNRRGSAVHYRKVVLSIGIVLNVLLLVYFKYANFIAENLERALVYFGFNTNLKFSPVHLPIGISFFTFQAISYLVDLYRRQVPAQQKLWKFAMYKTFFPQLIAGPIVRYKDLVPQIDQPKVFLPLFGLGVQRFVIGLSQKVLIANVLGKVANDIFNSDPHLIASPIAWLGAILYSLQIYFDFSGYSQMAIGLAMMFGFRIMDNFNFPYTATSITDFWRRWHISLSTWFRDYVYIPLGGNRVSKARNQFNLFLVFFLCGLWHGASWNFIAWGMLHGLLLILEKSFLLKLLERRSSAIRHLYTLTLIAIAWIFFRANSLSHAFQFLQAMFSTKAWTSPETNYFLSTAMTADCLSAFVFAIIFSMPVIDRLNPDSLSKQKDVLILFRYASTLALLIISVSSLSSGTFNPFIYFRF